MPTNVAAMKPMVEKGTTEVRWRGGRLAYRGGLGYRGLGYGLAAGAIVGGRGRPQRLLRRLSFLQLRGRAELRLWLRGRLRLWRRLCRQTLLRLVKSAI